MIRQNENPVPITGWHKPTEGISVGNLGVTYSSWHSEVRKDGTWRVVGYPIDRDDWLCTHTKYSS